MKKIPIFPYLKVNNLYFIYVNKNHHCRSWHMLVPKILLYYPQMWGYHPFKGSLLPANNKTTLDKTKKNISLSRRLSFIIYRLLKTKFNLILFLTATMDYSIHKSSLSSVTQLSSLKLLHMYFLIVDRYTRQLRASARYKSLIRIF